MSRKKTPNKERERTTKIVTTPTSCVAVIEGYSTLIIVARLYVNMRPSYIAILWDKALLPPIGSDPKWKGNTNIG